jgi:hypothetical protein
MIAPFLLLWLASAWSVVIMDGPDTGTDLRVHWACFVAEKRFKGSFVSTMSSYNFDRLVQIQSVKRLKQLVGGSHTTNYKH